MPGAASIGVETEVARKRDLKVATASVLPSSQSPRPKPVSIDTGQTIRATSPLWRG